jgi:hypothetical protein
MRPGFRIHNRIAALVLVCIALMPTCLSAQVDPSMLPRLPFSSTPDPSGKPDFKVCNDSSYEMAVAIVRTKGTLAAFTRDSWTAEGFAHVPRENCHDLHFGFMQNASAGFVSILLKVNGRWESPTYRERPSAFRTQDQTTVFGPRDIVMCWPDAGQADRVQPYAGCDSPARRVRFNLNYSVTGMTRDLMLLIQDGGFQETRTDRSYR